MLCYRDRETLSFTTECRDQRPCVRISPQDTSPVTPDDPSLQAAQWFSLPKFRYAGYENLISSRPSSALLRKLHRRVVQGKEAISDLTKDQVLFEESTG